MSDPASCSGMLWEIFPLFVSILPKWQKRPACDTLGPKVTVGI